MVERFRSWRYGAFGLVMAACVQFVVLTAAAMLFYPGGTRVDPTTSGYSFFVNFFSDLGLTHTTAGQPNTVSAILFVTALTLAGGGLVLFFLAYPRFFSGSRSGKVLSGTGSLFGVITGLCFVGVAFTPADLFLEAHAAFVIWAFRAFPLAAILYLVAIFRQRDVPNRYGWVFVAFAGLLVLYLLLLTVGPALDSAQGIAIQATGQKVIVYASIVSILVQANGARRMEDQRQSKAGDHNDPEA
jgi:hypothetical protein